MTVDDFNKFQTLITKYIPDKLESDDDYVFITDCLAEIRRNYVIKHKYKHDKNKKPRKFGGKNF